MTVSPELAAKLARLDALVAEHRLLPTVTVDLPWPAHGVGGLVSRLWAALVPDDALGPWVSIGQGPRTSDVAAFTADGLGITSTSADYGAVRGDATITSDWLVHRDWMITTYEISDCTMSALSFEIWAPAEQLAALAEVVRRVSTATLAAVDRS